MIDWKRMLKLLKCLNEDQVTIAIAKEFQAIIPKLNLKWKMTFKFKIE